MAALVIALLVGLPAGILAAIRRGTVVEYVMMIGSLFGISMPVFWIGLMLIYWLGAQAGWFPLSGAISTTVEVPTGDPLLYGGQRCWPVTSAAFKDVHLAPGPAGDHAEHDHHGDRLADGALEHARGARPRLPDHRPREGPARSAAWCWATR